MPTSMDKCPICGHKVEAYHELSQEKPFIHTNPFDGIHIYGAFSAPKETICYESNFLHFAFYNADGILVQHRLVQLGVENPQTKSPSDEILEASGDDDWEDDWDSDEDFYDETN